MGIVAGRLTCGYAVAGRLCCVDVATVSSRVYERHLRNQIIKFD